jgi:hypothetical protein
MMKTYTRITTEDKTHHGANRLIEKQDNSNATSQYTDNRTEAVVQKKLKTIDNNPRVQQLKGYQQMANNSLQMKKLTSYQKIADKYISNKMAPQAIQMQKQELKNNNPQAGHTVQRQVIFDTLPKQEALPIQKKENKTGLPDKLKFGIENFSGYSMDDVKVHYNSSKPAQLQAHAYAQGTNIHIAQGQERHLPHEAWHVVQQKQGRVRSTIQMKGNVNVNTDATLEREADLMGNKSLEYIYQDSGTINNPIQMQLSPGGVTQRASAFSAYVVNDLFIKSALELMMIGEDCLGIIYGSQAYLTSVIIDDKDYSEAFNAFMFVHKNLLKLGPKYLIIAEAFKVTLYEHLMKAENSQLFPKLVIRSLVNEIRTATAQYTAMIDKMRSEKGGLNSIEEIQKAPESSENQLAANADGRHYFQESGVDANRAKIVLTAISIKFDKAKTEKEKLIAMLKENTNLTEDQIQKAILFLRKNNVLFPSYPGPTLRSVKFFSLDNTAVDVEDTSTADKSLTDKIKSIIDTETILGGSMHDKIRNALIDVIVHQPDGAKWDAYRADLIALFKKPTAAKYYTDTYVRAGDEHEQLITSMTADQVLYDLINPGFLPVTKKGQMTHLEYQLLTNVETHYIVLKSITEHSDMNNKVSQNHHPTSKSLISFVDALDDQKLHGSPGSGAGSSPAYHKELAAKIGKTTIMQLNQELARINMDNLAGRFDILGIPETKRVNQTYMQTNGTTLHFNNKADLHKIARNVEVRRRKVLSLFYLVKMMVGDKSLFLTQKDVIDKGADSDDEMDKLPKTPTQHS